MPPSLHLSRLASAVRNVKQGARALHSWNFPPGKVNEFAEKSTVLVQSTGERVGNPRLAELIPVAGRLMKGVLGAPEYDALKAAVSKVSASIRGEGPSALLVVSGIPPDRLAADDRQYHHVKHVPVSGTLVAGLAAMGSLFPTGDVNERRNNGFPFADTLPVTWLPKRDRLDPMADNPSAGPQNLHMDGFVADHPPHVVALVCHENIPQVPTNFLSVSLVVAQLTKETQAILSQPLYYDRSYDGNNRPRPILSWANGHPKLVFSMGQGWYSEGPDAKNALLALQKAVADLEKPMNSGEGFASDNDRVRLNLMPGQLAVWNNHGYLHGRGKNPRGPEGNRHLQNYLLSRIRKVISVRAEVGGRS